MAFIVLALTQVFHAFNMRSKKSLFRISFFSNKFLLGAFFLSTALVALVVFVPALAYFFGLTTLPVKLYLIALLLSFVPIPVIELTKLFGLIKNNQHKTKEAF